MKKIGIVDVRTRLRNIPEGDVNYNRSAVYREQADKAIASGFPSRIIFCIESGIGDTSGSMSEDTMMDLFDALGEVGTESQIRKYGALIMNEYVSKTRDASETLKYMKQKLGRAKSKITTKIQNNFDDLWDATNSTIGNAKDNFKKNTEPYKNAIANAKTRAKQAGKKLAPKKEEAVVAAYEAMVEQATKIVSVDRILENYNKLSKRFNIDRIIQENTVCNDVADTCVEVCNLVDTYDMPVKARYNTALETVWYGLYKNGFTFNESEVVTTISDFYMASGGNSFACKSILEASMVFDKGDYMGDIDVITEEEPEDDEPIQEIFGLSKKEKEKRAADEAKANSEAKELNSTYKSHFTKIKALCTPKVSGMDISSKIDFESQYGAYIAIVASWTLDDYSDSNGNKRLSEAEKKMKAMAKKVNEYIKTNKLPGSAGINTHDDFVNVEISVPYSYFEQAISYEYMVEGKLSAKDRKKIADKDYGIPSKRKYPMPDESHVRSAIQMFNHVDSADEAELARNIKKKIKQYGMSVDVGKENRFSKYYKAANENGVLTAQVREFATNNSGYPIHELTDQEDSDFKKILNDYKVSNDADKPNKLMALVRKLYSLSPENIIDGTPSLLKYVRGILVIGGFAINPVIGVIAFIADQVTKAHMNKEEAYQMREAFKNEIRSTQKKIDNTKSATTRENLEKYNESLLAAYKKIDEYYESTLTDKELDAKYDAADDDDISTMGGGEFGDAELDAFEKMFGDDFDMDDDFGDLDDMDGFEESGKFVVLMGHLIDAYNEGGCEEKSFDQHKCKKMIRMNPSIVGDLAKVSDKYPQIISKHDLANAIDDVRSDIQIGAVRINMIERYELNNTYDEIMRSRDTIIETTDIFQEAKRFAAGIEISKALNEIYSTCTYYSPLTEASFTNSLKLAGEKLKKGIQKAADADKTISKNIDSSMSAFTRAAERAMTNDRRDAIIKGSVIPSASKVIKGAIMTGAAWLVLGPAVAVIGVLGYLGVSKKLNDKQRKALIDEIEIELKMCQKYIDLAESKNDLKALKKLYTIQRELEKQRGRIKYRIAQKGEKYHDPEKLPTVGVED